VHVIEPGRPRHTCWGTRNFVNPQTWDLGNPLRGTWSCRTDYTGGGGAGTLIDTRHINTVEIGDTFIHERDSTWSGPGGHHGEQCSFHVVGYYLCTVTQHARSEIGIHMVNQRTQVISDSCGLTDYSPPSDTTMSLIQSNVLQSPGGKFNFGGQYQRVSFLSVHAGRRARVSHELSGAEFMLPGTPTFLHNGVLVQRPPMSLDEWIGDVPSEVYQEKIRSAARRKRKR
jgi:hypothetical protein